MKRKIGRVILSLLFLAVSFNIVPTPVSAAVVAKIGNKSYANFNSALKAVRAGETITLMKNAKFETQPSMFEYCTFEKKFTLNLNSRKLTVTNQYSSQYKVSGTIDISKPVTIKNGTLVGSICLEDGGSLNISGCTFETMKEDSQVTIQARGNKSKAVVNKCKGKKLHFLATGNNTKMTISRTTVSEYCKIEAGQGYDATTANKAVITVNSGTYNHKRDDSYSDNGLLNVGPKGKLIINDGKFTTATPGLLLFYNKGTMTMKGGTFTSKAWHLGMNDKTVRIEGGTFSHRTKNCAGILNYGTLKMTGGKIVSTGKYSIPIVSEGRDTRVIISAGTVQSKKTYCISGPKGTITIGEKAVLLAPEGVDPIREIEYID